MAATPPEVTEIMRQLEPILTRWFNSGELGEVATVIKEDKLQIEERPMTRAFTLNIKRTLSRAKAIGLAR